MLLSSSLLTKAARDYSFHTQENFEEESRADGSKKGASTAFYTAVLVFAMILFVFEIVVLVHAIKIALKCSRPGSERIAHLVLATFFTYPYLLFALFLSNCAITV